METIKRTFIHGVVAATLVLMLVLTASGETVPESSDVAASLQSLVTESLNPVSKMVKVPFQNNFDFGIGPNKVTRYTLDLEPIVPFSLNENWNLITRSIIPVISQPAAGPHQVSMDGLGDINPSIFLSPANSRNHFWGFGPTFTFPTGTSPQLTSGQWSLGPTVVYMTMPGQWMIGAVANHQWSVGGWGARSVSASYIQPMVMYHLPMGWYLVSVPVITANWATDSRDRWTVPVGGGAGKVVKLDNLPLNLQLQAFYNVERPHNSADWQLRFQLLFLFPK
jgi:hypothetical protein